MTATMILKIVRYVLLDVMRNRWVLGYAVFFFALTDVLLRLGGSGPRALLSLLNVVVLLIPLVTIVFGTIYWHGAREFNELLLSQPVERRSVGGGQRTVTRSLRSQSTRSGPSRTTSSSSTTRVAPDAKASHVSSTDES